MSASPFLALLVLFAGAHCGVCCMIRPRSTEHGGGNCSRRHIITSIRRRLPRAARRFSPLVLRFICAGCWSGRSFQPAEMEAEMEW